MSKTNYAELTETARRVRIDALKAIAAAGSGHPGGSLSAADIITTLYFNVMNIDPRDPQMEDRDKFVLSKGHAVPALYAALCERGFFPVEDMMTLRKIDSPFQGHPNMRKVPGIEMSTGSLGQGFAAAVGMATANKIDGKDGRVFVLTGDGELQEGIIWEAAMSAAHRKLDNLTAVVDLNGLQIDGRVDDGHSFPELIEAFESARHTKGVPTVIIANTVKGKGVSFMEDQAGWHGKAPDQEQLAQAISELGGDN